MILNYYELFILILNVKHNILIYYKQKYCLEGMRGQMKQKSEIAPWKSIKLYLKRKRYSSQKPGASTTDNPGRNPGVLSTHRSTPKRVESPDATLCL